MQPSYAITENSISFFLNNDIFTIGSDHRMFGAIRTALRDQQWDLIPSLIDQAKAINAYLANNAGAFNSDQVVYVQNGELYYNNNSLGEFASEFILRMMNDGFDVSPFLNYLSKLQRNPSMRNRRDQFEWLVRGNMPITPEGNVIAFKKVRDDFRDYYSGKFDNSPGTIVAVERFDVDDDINNTCSNGLHFCSREYLKHYYGNQGKVIIVEIDPADIVAFPRDYNVTKGRCCGYKVIGVIPEDQVGDAFGEVVITTAQATASTEDNDFWKAQWRFKVQNGETEASFDQWMDDVDSDYEDEVDSNDYRAPTKREWWLNR